MQPDWDDGQGRGGAGAWSSASGRDPSPAGLGCVPPLTLLSGFPNRAQAVHSSIISQTGCPSIVLPVGTVDSLPIGMQIVCRRGDDERLLRMAAYLEEVLWGGERPGYLPSHRERARAGGGCYRRGLIEPRDQLALESKQVGPTTVEEVEKMHEAAQAGTDARLAQYMAAGASS